MVRVFVTITQQLTLAQVTRKFCTQKGFSDHLAVKHENFTGTVCIFVNGGGGGKQLAKFSYGFILSPQIDFEYFVSHHHVLKLVHRSSRINDKFSKYVIWGTALATKVLLLAEFWVEYELFASNCLKDEIKYLSRNVSLKCFAIRYYIRFSIFTIKKRKYRYSKSVMRNGVEFVFMRCPCHPNLVFFSSWSMQLFVKEILILSCIFWRFSFTERWTSQA